MSGFSNTVAVQESLRNVAANRLAATITAVAAFALAAAATGFTIVETGAIEDEYRSFVASGGYVAVVQDRELQLLDATRCEDLGSLSGVIAAGGLVSETQAQSPLSATTAITMIRGTAGVIPVLWPGGFAETDPVIGTTVAGATVGERFGLRAGGGLTVTGAGSERFWFQFGAVALPSARSDTYDNAFFEASSAPGGVAECLVEVNPGSERAVGNVLVGWFGQDVAITPYAAGKQNGPALIARLSVFALPIAGLVSLGFFSFSIFGRRAEFALYSMLDSSPRTRTVMLAVDYCATVFAPAAAGVLVAISLGAETVRGTTLEILAHDVAGFGALLCIGPALGFMILSKSATLEYLRGR